MSRRFRGVVANLMLTGAAVAAALCLVELVLRIVGPPPNRYYALLPHSGFRTEVPPGLIPGVHGTARYSVNASGIRGRPFGPDAEEYRVLAVGGSTTECAVLDDSLAWPHLLETKLGRTENGRRVWVGNVGRSGRTARDHAVQLKYLLPQFPRIDVVVLLVGVNDMHAALSQGDGYRRPRPITEPDAEAQQLRRAFSWTPLPHQRQRRLVPRWLRTTALWQLARRVRQASGGPELRIDEALDQAHRIRTTSPAVDTLPLLDEPLAEYRETLEHIVTLTRSASVRLVFVTQPALWRAEMPAEEERLLWFGRIGPHPDSTSGYYTARVLERAMGAYNDVLRDVCRSHAVECVDAAAILPRDTTIFYDDVHFNIPGSRALASLLEDHLSQRSPFARLKALGNQ